MEPERKALVRKLVIGAGILTVTLPLGIGLYNLIVNRPPKFARIVAQDFPADSLGIVALADPAHSLELLDAAIPSELGDKLETMLGFDPYSVSSYAALGFDLEAPIGAAMRGLDEPIVMVSLGLDDAALVRATIHEWSAKEGIDNWTDREFDGVDGMWMAEPPVAIVFRGERMLIVGAEDLGETEAVEDTANELASLSQRDSFAESPAFANVHRFPGDPLLVMVANIDAIDDHPATKMAFGSTDIETMAFALCSDDRDIHMVWQTIFGTDSEYLGYMRDGDRTTRALDQVESPVYAGIHWATNPDYLSASLESLGGIGRNGLEETEREVEAELGVDLQDDLLAAWTGEFGLLWTGAGEGAWGGLMFVGVRDESTAEQTLEQIWSNTEGEDKRETDAGTVYSWNESPPLEAKIYDDRAWFGFGESRLGSIDGDGRGFRKTTDVDAIADVVNSGSTVVGFVDMIEVRAVIETLPDAEQLSNRYADVLETIDGFTMRSEIDGRTMTWTMTLHTNVDDAFDTLVERIVADALEETADLYFQF